MRILITNADLAARGGAVLYVRDITRALLARGHTPVVYSPYLGHVADEIRASGVAVARDIRDITEPPDIIHGQQHPEIMVAMLAFPGVPAVFFCHDFEWWGSKPAVFPRLLRYVAVDRACRDRLTLENGIPPERIELLLNFVDLARFKPRSPLPPKPQRALVFSNYASEENYIPAVRTACAAAGIELDVIGLSSGKAVELPEDVLGQYDLVFAKARAALEAMAVGAAVIVCDARGVAGMVTTANFDELRPLNFGRRALRLPVSAETLAPEIARYDAENAAAVARRVRADAGLEDSISQIIALYEDVIAEARRLEPFDTTADARAGAAYIQEQIESLHGYQVLRRSLRKLLALPLIGPAARAFILSRRKYNAFLRALGD